jgi:hypothetical protein
MTVWTSMYDEIPDPGEACQVRLGDGSRLLARYVGQGRFECLAAESKILNVVAWAPLETDDGE